jgi:hypothetical protein
VHVRSWFKSLSVAALILLLTTVVSLWLILRGSLPQLDGEIVLDGLADAATIERDKAGITTITASSRADLAYATGLRRENCPSCSGRLRWTTTNAIVSIVFGRVPVPCSNGRARRV